jgi:drug/metabolite transporter (DMT)-like permease
MVITSICIAFMGVMVKQLGHLPVAEIILFRNIPTMIIIPSMIKKAKIPLFGYNKTLLWFSSLINAINVIAMYYALTVINLTDAITIRNLSPFFTFFLAGIFLKEKIYLRQMPFFMFAFLGGLLVIKPGLRLDMLPALIALVAAICIAISQVTLRHLRLTDHYLVIVNYFAYISGIVSLIILLVQKNFQFPSLSDCLVLILLGGVVLLALIALTKAYQLAPASLISLYTYSQIIFASLFGLLFFKEIPDIFSIMGASCIIISGYLNYRYKTNNLI